MRILLSTDTTGGVWDYTAVLSRELRQAGHEVLLAAIGEPTDDQRAQLPSGVEVEARIFRLEWMPDAAVDVGAAGLWLSGVAERWAPDVVHLNQLAYAVHPFPAPTLVVVHSDVLSWFGEVLGEAAPPEWSAYEEWVRAGIAAADVLVAPSRYQATLTAKHLGRAPDVVIWNGAPVPAGEPGTRASPLLLSVGRAWDRAKGMKTFDIAVGLLGRQAPPAHLLGEERGPHGERFEARNVTSHGRSGRLAVDRWMGMTTAYVAASLYEPFGLAPLEAALHGCALVLSDIGSFRELWDGCAEFFPPGDAAALADRIAWLHAEPERWRERAVGCRARALERYTVAAFASEYLALYEEMRRS